MHRNCKGCEKHLCVSVVGSYGLESFFSGTMPSDTSHVAMAAARQRGFELLNHPPYSPDLAPSEFYLFPKLKSVLRGRVYDTDSDVIDAENEFLTGQDSSFYYDGIAKLEERWEKCVRAQGDYI